MNWIFYSIISRAFWAGTNIIEKIIIGKYIQRPEVYLFFTSTVGLIVLLLIPFRGLLMPTLPILLACILAGVLYIYALLPYFEALKHQEASRVVPIFNLVPVFILIISALFLGETLTLRDYLAFIVLVAGGVLISIEKTKSKLKLNRGFWLMVGATFLFSIESILADYTLRFIPFTDSFIWLRIGSFLAILPLFLLRNYTKDLMHVFKKTSSKIKGVIVTSELLNLAGIASIVYAFALGSVTLASALQGLQPAFVLIFTIALSLWMPKLLKEDISKETISLKIASLGLMGVGIYLLS